MARSYDLSDAIVLPRLDADAGDALATQTETVANTVEELPPPIKVALTKVKDAKKKLRKGLAGRLRGRPVDPRRARDADTAVDSACSSLHDWLYGWTKLDDNSNEVALALTLYAVIFPDGLKFTQIPFKLQWAQVGARIRRVEEDETLIGSFTELGGMNFWRHLKRTQKVYGEALGLTSVEDPEDLPANIREPLLQLQRALRTYVVRVMAHVDDDEPETGELAEKLLGPIREWQIGGSRSTAAEEPEPGEGSGGANGGAGGDKSSA